jgi:hypothetical protein
MSETVTHSSPVTAAPGGVTKIALTAGSTSSPVYTPDSCVISCTPGGGGTMLAEATWSLPAEVEAGTARWFSWDAGTVSAAANQLLQHATAVRFTATTTDGVGEVAS